MYTKYLTSQPTRWQFLLSLHQKFNELLDYQSTFRDATFIPLTSSLKREASSGTDIVQSENEMQTQPPVSLWHCWNLCSHGALHSFHVRLNLSTASVVVGQNKAKKGKASMGIFALFLASVSLLLVAGERSVIKTTYTHQDEMKVCLSICICISF